MKRLVAFDLDGTISVSNRKVPADTLGSLSELRARGYLIAFVSGRRQVDMLPMQEQVAYADYIVLNNGALIYKTDKPDEYLRHELVPKADAKTLIEECLTNNLVIDVITSTQWYANAITEGDLAYAKKISHTPQIFSDVSEIDLAQVEGFMITHIVDEIQSVIDECGLNLQCVESEPRCADVMSARVSKWRALEFICKREDLEHGQVVAVGNYTNDIEMIKSAGTGVAVADALPEVISAADIVLTSRHDQNPVAELLEYIS